MFNFFFFSSRRRHTRLQGDWSSDVCSSDLRLRAELPLDGAARPGGAAAHAPAGVGPVSGERRVGEEGRSRWAPDHLKKKKKRLCDDLATVYTWRQHQQQEQSRAVANP